MEPATADRTASTDSAWQRFLAGRTVLQRAVLAVGALAAASLAVLAVVRAVAAAADGVGGRDVASAAEGGVDIANQSGDADDLVRFLLKRAGGAPVTLDHRVHAPIGNGGEVRLEYACGSTGCRTARLESPAYIESVLPDGRWYRGCYGVSIRIGSGYGGEPLYLELRHQGPTCAT